MRPPIFLSIPVLAGLLISLAHANPTPPPDHLLHYQTNRAYSIYDREEKAGWSQWTIGPAEYEGKPVFRYFEREERVGLYFQQKQTLVYEYEEIYSATAPYELLLQRNSNIERGFTKTVEIRPEPGKPADYKAVILEDGKRREIQIKGDGSPFTLSDFWAIETRLGQTPEPEIGARYTTRTFDSEEMQIEPVDCIVMEKLGPGEFRLALEAKQEGRFAVADINTKGDWLRYEYTWGDRYESVASTAEAQKDLGNYSFVGVWEIPIDKKLGSPNGVTDLTVAAAGDWRETLRETDLQSFSYDAAKDITTIRIGSGAGKPEAVTPEEREKGLRATGGIPVNDPDIVAVAQKAVEGAANDREKVEMLCAFVSRSLDYQIDLDPLSIDASLAQKRGDCSEHADLFTALARSLGIPTRSTQGWVYMGDESQSFGYHAWNEVAIDGYWKTLDPTWGEMIPNATHIKMITSEVDQKYAKSIRDGAFSLEVVSVKSQLARPIAEADRLIKRYPKEAAWLEQRATLRAEKDDLRGSIRDMRTAIAMAPNVAEYHQLLAYRYLEADDLKRAISALEQATKLSPLHPAYWSELAICQTKAGRFEGAIHSMTEALNLQPRHLDYLKSRAFLYMHTGVWAKALEDLDQAIALAAGDASLQSDKGTVLRRLGKPQPAEQAFTAALALEPELADAWAYRALVRAELKDQKGAQEDAEKALNLEGLSDELREELKAVTPKS